MEKFISKEAEVRKGFGEKVYESKVNLIGKFFETHPKSRRALEAAGIFLLMSKVIVGGELQAAMPPEEKQNKEDDTFFTEQVESVSARSDSVYNDEIAPGHVDVIFIERFHGSAGGGESVFNKERKGNLPESGDNIYIDDYIVNIKAQENGYKSYFDIVTKMGNVKEGEVVPVGDPIIIRAFGSTKEEALADALRQGSEYMGVHVRSETRQVMSSEKDNNMSNDFVETRCTQYIDSYDIVGEEQKDDRIILAVKIQPGEYNPNE